MNTDNISNVSICYKLGLDKQSLDNSNVIYKGLCKVAQLPGWTRRCIGHIPFSFQSVEIVFLWGLSLFCHMTRSTRQNKFNGLERIHGHSHLGLRDDEGLEWLRDNWWQDYSVINGMLVYSFWPFTDGNPGSDGRMFVVFLCWGSYQTFVLSQYLITADKRGSCCGVESCGVIWSAVHYIPLYPGRSRLQSLIWQVYWGGTVRKTTYRTTCKTIGILVLFYHG